MPIHIVRGGFNENRQPIRPAGFAHLLREGVSFTQDRNLTVGTHSICDRNPDKELTLSPQNRPSPDFCTDSGACTIISDAMPHVSSSKGFEIIDESVPSPEGPEPHPVIGADTPVPPKPKQTRNTPRKTAQQLQWDDIDLHSQFHLYGRAAERLGLTMTFSINLEPSHIDIAMAAVQNLRQWAAKQINNALADLYRNANLPFDYFAAIEPTNAHSRKGEFDDRDEQADRIMKDRRFGIHGLIRCPDINVKLTTTRNGKRQVRTMHLSDAIRIRLKEYFAVNGINPHKQVEVKPFDQHRAFQDKVGVRGWVAYCLKARVLTSYAADHIVGHTAPLIRSRSVVQAAQALLGEPDELAPDWRAVSKPKRRRPMVGLGLPPLHRFIDPKG